jgi:hypothetical protein
MQIMMNGLNDDRDAKGAKLALFFYAVLTALS